MSTPTIAELEAGILELVINDLKLDDVEMTVETPLSVEDLDLDSLDFLMLVASIEKAYGVRIPNDKLGPETMKDVRTLASFVHEQLS